MTSVLHLVPWLLAPIALPQGLRLRRSALRLPPAAGEAGVVGVGDDPLRIAVVGDSVAAGVGLDHHEESMAGRVAGLLAQRHDRPVAWSVIAVSGATAADARVLLGDGAGLAEADVVLVSIGVNDTKNLHTRDRWRRELGRLLDAVLDAAPRADVLLFGIPPMEKLPALPRPLADFLGARSRVMDGIGREVAALRPRVRRVEGQLDWQTDWFAADGIHPSAQLHARFAEAALGALSVSRTRLTTPQRPGAATPRAARPRRAPRGRASDQAGGRVARAVRTPTPRR